MIRKYARTNDDSLACGKFACFKLSFVQWYQKSNNDNNKAT